MDQELPNSPLRVFYTNIQSLRYKARDLEVEVQDCDIICLTETWLGPRIKTPQLKITNFDGPARKDREGQEYGGVCMYVRSGIPWKHRKDLESDSVECTWIEVTSSVGKIILGCLYRPPSSKSDHWRDIQNVIARVTDSGCNVIITGDINCDQMALTKPLQSYSF